MVTRRDRRIRVDAPDLPCLRQDVRGTERFEPFDANGGRLPGLAVTDFAVDEHSLAQQQTDRVQRLQIADAFRTPASKRVVDRKSMLVMDGDRLQPAFQSPAGVAGNANDFLYMRGNTRLERHPNRRFVFERTNQDDVSDAAISSSRKSPGRLKGAIVEVRRTIRARDQFLESTDQRAMASPRWSSRVPGGWMGVTETVALAGSSPETLHWMSRRPVTSRSTSPSTVVKSPRASARSGRPMESPLREMDRKSGM